MDTSDWIALGALAISATALFVGEVRARRAKTIRNERSDVRWEFSWPEAGTIRVTNRGWDTAHDVDIEFTHDYIVSSGKCATVDRDGYVDLKVAHLRAAWAQADAPGQIEEQRSDGTTRIVRFPIHFGALVWWRSKSGSPLWERFDSVVYRDIDGQPRVVRPTSD
jgi:hypothetical protein